MTIKNPVRAQLIKFLTVGVTNTAISYLTFAIVYNLLLTDAPFISQSISYGVGIVWSFVWNRNWTFSAADGGWSRFAPFFMVQTGLLILSASTMKLADQFIPVSLNIIWFFVMTAITALNFYLTKRCVFKSPS